VGLPTRTKNQLQIRTDASEAQDLYARADPAGIKEAKARLEALRR